MQMPPTCPPAYPPTPMARRGMQCAGTGANGMPKKREGHERKDMHTTVCTTVCVPVRHGMAWHAAYRVPEPCRAHRGKAVQRHGTDGMACHGRWQGAGARGKGAGRARPETGPSNEATKQDKQRGKKVERKTLREAAGGTVLDVRDKDQEAQLVRGVMVSIGAFQALVPGSIPGGRMLFLPPRCALEGEPFYLFDR